MKFLPPILSLGILVGSGLGAADTLPVSIFSRTAKGYKRAHDKDGTPKREYYAIGYGGRVDGTTWDDTQAQDHFPEIAGVVAQHLARENFYFAENSAKADLLIVIHWGRTIPFNNLNYGNQVNQLGDAVNRLNIAETAIAPLEPTGPEGVAGYVAEREAQLQEISSANAALGDAISFMSVEEKARDQQNEANAQLLGYMSTMSEKQQIGGTIGRDRFDELRLEVEDPRYYVVVSAYDFTELVKREKQKLLWVTRISIRTRGHDFMNRVDQMVARAAHYFGRDSGRLIRDHRGEVEIGEAEVIGITGPETDD